MRLGMIPLGTLQIEFSLEGELIMSAQVCQFAARNVQSPLFSKKEIPMSGARIYEFPSQFVSRPVVQSAAKTGCLRGATYALAAESAAVFCLYALWQLWHMVR